MEEGGAEAKAGSPSKKRGKAPLVIGIVAVAVAAVALGFWNWHQSPEFCGSVCHDSMDAYVESYQQVPGRAGVDKYGNEVSNCSAMLVVSHKEANLACLDCHIPTVSQQLGEVTETVTGDYFAVERKGGSGLALQETDLDTLMANSGQGDEKSDRFCMKSGCHELSRSDLTAVTADMEFNPHRWQHGEIACSKCHKSHRASVFSCTECHSDAEKSLPEGWVSAADGEKLLPEGA